MFYVPTIPGFSKLVDTRSYSFLITHRQLDRHLLFDLGMRKDWDTVPYIKKIADSGVKITVEKNTREVLEEGGFDAKKLEAVIWSHWHLDHTGDPATFEKGTALIVGPGFKDNVLPGYPANPESSFLEKDYEGRELREISFEAEGTVKIGQFSALDYFRDGSFYLLDAPGHTIGHMCGLARVTSDPDSFILMGGDTCHHGGELRPTKYMPLPANVSPNPFTSLTAPMTPCPGAMFSSVLRDGDTTRPIYDLSPTGVHFDVAEAAKTIGKLQTADCKENILVVLAHDTALPGVVDFFPNTADQFMEKGWVKELRWRFLRDFAKAVGYDGEVEGRSTNWATWNETN